MPQKTLSEWLTYIEQQVQGPKIQLGLERVKAVATKLNLYPFPHRVVTVAGTNGKGSTVAFIEALAISHGLQVMSITSPHMIQFNERIKRQASPLPDEVIIDALALVGAHKGDVSLTYYEWTMLALLAICNAQTGVDLVVLEIGLGGLLDALNIIDPDVSVITGIAYDHQHILGDTLHDIGLQKAGIFRANRPAVIGSENPPSSVLDYAKKIHAKPYIIHQQVKVIRAETDWTFSNEALILNHLPYPALHLDNAVNAICAYQSLGEELIEERVQQAMQRAYAPGRLEWVDERQQLLLDVAHNAQSITGLIDYLKTLNRPVYACFAMREDKNYQACFNALQPHVAEFYVALLPETKEAEVMRNFYLNFKNVNFFDNVVSAYQALRASKPIQAITIVTGSFQTVGMIKAFEGIISEGFSASRKDIR